MMRRKARCQDLKSVLKTLIRQEKNVENRSFLNCYHFPFLINFSRMKTLLKAWLAYNRPTIDGWSCVPSVKLS